jgi:hypothetical protein
MRATVVVFGVLLLVAFNVRAATLEKRLALVIGNSSYRLVPKLLNPVNNPN